MDEIDAAIREYVLSEFLAGEDADELTEATPLITGGIMDSIATVKLVAFLQERFKVKIRPNETTVDYLDTLADIGKLVRSKR